MRMNALLCLVILILSGCGVFREPPERSYDPSTTFLCDGGRQFVASFNTKATQATIMYEGKNRLLKKSGRQDSGLTFSDGVATLVIPEGQPAWLEHEGVVSYQNCTNVPEKPSDDWYTEPLF